MELDTELEQRVWQRVHGCPGEVFPEEFPTLIAHRLGAAAEYARLSRQTRYRASFARLERNARKQASCLLGLHRLGGGNGRISPLPPAGREENALARCIREELRFIQACAGQTGQWMPVLEALETPSRENLLLLLEILGDK